MTLERSGPPLPPVPLPPWQPEQFAAKTVAPRSALPSLGRRPRRRARCPSRCPEPWQGRSSRRARRATARRRAERRQGCSPAPGRRRTPCPCARRTTRCCWRRRPVWKFQRRCPFARVVRLELAVRAPEEDEVPLGRARPRVAGLGERLLPDPAPAERVDRGKGSRRGGVRGAREQRGDVVLPSLVLDAGDRHLPRRLHGRADVEVVRLGVVADRVPVHSALRARHDRDEFAEAGRGVDLLRRHDLEPLHLRRERLS